MTSKLQDEAMDSVTPYQPMVLRRVLSTARDLGWLVVEGNLCELARALGSDASDAARGTFS